MRFLFKQTSNYSYAYERVRFTYFWFSSIPITFLKSIISWININTHTWEGDLNRISCLFPFIYSDSRKKQVKSLGQFIPIMLLYGKFYIQKFMNITKLIFVFQILLLYSLLSTMLKFYNFNTRCDCWNLSEIIASVWGFIVNVCHVCVYVGERDQMLCLWDSELYPILIWNLKIDDGVYRKIDLFCIFFFVYLYEQKRGFKLFSLVFIDFGSVERISNN